MFELGQRRNPAALRTSKCVCLFIYIGDDMDNYYMNIAYKLATKAYLKGDVPVGTVIVKDNKIITKAYNKKEKHNNAIYHAELLAIKKACKKLKTWHLENCTLYTTLEPCPMCIGAIIQSRIGTICYAADNNNYSEIDILKKYNKQIEIRSGILKKESSDLLTKFFKEQRK